MRRGLVAALLVALVTSGAIAGGPLVVNGLGQPMTWNTAAPVAYNPDQGTLGTLSNAEAKALLAEAFAVWAQGPSDITFVEGPLLPQNVNATANPLANPAHFRNFYRKPGDGWSPVIFDTDGSIIDAYFGAGARFEILGIAGIDTPAGASTQIDEASIIINGAFFDGLGPPSSPPDVSREALKAAMVHEIGHFINLGHTAVNHELALDGNPGNDVYVPTMFPVAVDDEEALASTNPDDDLAALNLYPAGAPSNSISGSVVSAGVPFQGANVVFRKVGDPLMTAYALISGAQYFPCNPASPCDPCHTVCDPGHPAAQGAFAADFFAPGSYTVCVEQIDTRYSIENSTFIGPLATPPILPGPEECFDLSEGSGQSDDPDDASPVVAGSAAPVNIVLDALPVTDPFEPNNTLGTGATLGDLPTGQDTAPGLLAAGDLDVFLVPVVAGQRVRIDLDARELGSPLDAVVGFYDASNTLVARVDDAPDPDSSSFSFDPAIELVATFTGTAKVVVSSYPDLDQDGVGGGSTGPYWLRVEVATDTDGDGAPDASDICPSTPFDDPDRDGVCFGADNCPTESNPTQDAPVKISGTLPAFADVTSLAIAADDSRVVFIADRDNDEVFELFSVPVAGGVSPVKISSDLGASAKDVTAFMISPNGARVVYLADQDADEVFELYSVPIAGGTVTKLSGAMVTGGDVLEFNVSPDSSAVVYRADEITDGVGELFSVPIGGGTPVKLNPVPVAGGGLVNPGAGFSSFLFSADSTTVVYDADQDVDEKFEIYTVPIGGGTAVRLNGAMIAAGDIRNFQMDGINARVVYAADQAVDEVVEIYSVPMTGGAATKLNGTLPPGAAGWQRFRITPDGQTVVYVADQDTATVFELYAVPITGGTITKLSGTMVSGGDVFGIGLPVGPGDGNRMTYRSDQEVDGRFELFSVPIAGGTPIKLNAPLVAGGNVTAQGSGIFRSTVLFVADQNTDEQFELFSVPATGGTPAKVTGTMVAGGDYQGVSWDSTKIAVRADKDADEVLELYGVRLEGGEPLKLNGPLVSGGDVSNWTFTTGSHPGRVVYVADEEVDEKFELYSRTFSLDTDADGVFDRCDLCPVTANASQADVDGNGVGDACEACGVGSDPDADGICGAADNCPEVANISQADFDADGVGDACDADDDNDGLSDVDESAHGTNPLDADSDNDGTSDGDEVAAGTDPNAAPSRPESVAFGPQRTISTSAAGAYAVFAADLDGDGDLDLLSASFADDKIAWYENLDGKGNFGVQHVITALADGARSVVAADLDGDGDDDVVSASNVNDTVAWYENTDGLGTFGPQHVVTNAAYNAHSVVVADVDGDGRLDIVSGSLTDNEVAWYRNTDGLGTFGALQLISTTTVDVNAVFAADVDDDGDTDVLAASASGGKIVWFENTDGAGAFGPEQVIHDQASPAWAVTAGDMDRDGDTDVLSASWGDGKLQWYENDGTPGGLGDWAVHTIAPPDAVYGATWVVPADFDEDGDLDAVAVKYSKLVWYENLDGSGTFGPEQLVSPIGNYDSDAVLAGDIDGDGDVDIVSAEANTTASTNKIAWVENQTIHRNAVFSARNLISSAVAGAVSVDAGDIDGDGDVDALQASGQGDTIKWFASDGAVVPSWTARTVGTTAAGLEYAELCDVDRDGDPDVIAAAGGGDTIAWYENGGQAVPSWTAHTVSVSQDNPLFVTCGDLDGDGDVDLVASSYADARVSWYRSDGGSPPSFTELVISVSSVSTWRRGLAVADMDGDGDLDIVAAVPNLGVHWYANDGAATPGWTERVITNTFGLTTFVAVADINGDGDLDVVATEYTGNRIGWFENGGGSDPSFTLHAFVMPTNQWGLVSAKDLDRDGDVDLVASAGVNGFVWFDNDGNDPPAWTTRAVSSDVIALGGMRPADMDGDGDVDLLLGLFTSQQGHRVEWWENRGGQFSLTTTSLAPATLRNGSTTALMAIDVASRARTGDHDVELASLELLVTDAAGSALSSAEANALIDRVRVYLDDGSSTFVLGSDTLVATVEDLSLSPLVVPFAKGDPRVRLAPAQSKRLFIVIETTADASTRSPNAFRVTHVANGGSRARDAANGTALRMEAAGSVTTPTVTAIGDTARPFVTGVYPPAGAVDVSAHTNVIVFVSEPVDPTTAALGVSLSTGGQKVAGKVAVADDGRAVSFDPDAPLSLGADFVLQVSAALRDRSGNGATPFASSFSATNVASSGTIDPGTLGGASGGSVLEGGNADDNSGFSAAAVGDVNLPATSNGISDLVVGAPNADAGAVDAGEARLIFGGPGLQSASGTVVSVTYRTGTAGDHIGETVARAGDLNHDGIQDFLIGAPGSAQAPAGSGVVYLVFGNPGLPGVVPGPLDLDDLAGCAAPTLCGVKFVGEAAGDNAGAALSFAGDVNADGFDDLLIGAPNATPPGRASAGKVYLVYGPLAPGTIALASVGATTRGLAFYGESAGDHAGTSVSVWKDRNSDGIDDVLLGAPGAVASNDVGAPIPDAGYVYAIHGGTQPGHLVDTATPGVIELSRVANGAPDQVAGVVFVGSEPGGAIGRSVAGAIDTDGNGTDDILVSGDGIVFAIPGDGPKIIIGNTQTGGGTSTSGLARTFDALNAVDDFHAVRYRSGDSDRLVVGPAGDLNHDGFDDFVIGAPLADGPAGQDSGKAYVILGAPATTQADRSLADVGGTIGGFVLTGAGAGDNLGASVGGGFDLNADGVDDGLVGAPFADTQSGTPTDAGETYVISPLHPDEVAQLTVQNTGGGVLRVEWSITQLSAGYNVYSGLLSTLRSLGGVRTSGMDHLACGTTGDTDADQLPDIIDARSAPPSDGFFFLVTARNAQGEGPLGSGTPTRANDSQCP